MNNDTIVLKGLEIDFHNPLNGSAIVSTGQQIHSENNTIVLKKLFKIYENNTIVFKGFQIYSNTKVIDLKIGQNFWEKLKVPEICLKLH